MEGRLCFQLNHQAGPTPGTLVASLPNSKEGGWWEGWDLTASLGSRLGSVRPGWKAALWQITWAEWACNYLCVASTVSVPSGVRPPVLGDAVPCSISLCQSEPTFIAALAGPHLGSTPGLSLVRALIGDSTSGFCLLHCFFFFFLPSSSFSPFQLPVSSSVLAAAVAEPQSLLPAVQRRSHHLPQTASSALLLKIKSNVSLLLQTTLSYVFCNACSDSWFKSFC